MTSGRLKGKIPTATDLDRPEIYEALDPSGMRCRLRNLPRQFSSAWQQAQTAPLPGLQGSYDKVVISGMGGSAISGDLVVDLASLKPAAPILVARSLHLPFYPDRNTLFISCSHSGNTRETLAMFRDACATDAAILAVTAGGTLAREAAAQEIPVVAVDIPGEPRSAVGYNLALLLGILNRLELVEMAEAEVDNAVAVLEDQLAVLAESVPTARNPAKQLAGSLLGKLVGVYGGGIFSGAARRWKAQINENAKTWAFYDTVPECLHNSVESFGAGFPAGHSLFALVLKPAALSPELDARYRALSHLLDRGEVQNRSLVGIAGSPLAQLMSMVLLGDYVSYYLALLQGLDPSPTPVIDLGKDLVR